MRLQFVVLSYLFIANRATFTLLVLLILSNKQMAVKWFQMKKATIKPPSIYERGLHLNTIK